MLSYKIDLLSEIANVLIILKVQLQKEYIFLKIITGYVHFKPVSILSLTLI